MIPSCWSRPPLIHNYLLIYFFLKAKHLLCRYSTFRLSRFQFQYLFLFFHFITSGNFLSSPWCRQSLIHFQIDIKKISLPTEVCKKLNQIEQKLKKLNSSSSCLFVCVCVYPSTCDVFNISANVYALTTKDGELLIKTDRQLFGVIRYYSSFFPSIKCSLYISFNGLQLEINLIIHIQFT